MRPAWVTPALVAAVLGGLGLSVWAGPNLSVAVPGALLAAAGAAGLAVAVIAERVHRPGGVPQNPEGDPLVLLREAFRAGSLGRAAIVAEVRSLERRLGGAEISSFSPEEERRLLAAPPEEFRRWVGLRITRLERET